MSIAHGKVMKLSYKDWPPNDKNPEGNRTYSVLLQDDAGGEQWFTNYAYEKHGQPPEGATITASVEQKGKYPYFTDYQIEGASGAGMTPASASVPNNLKRPVESNSSGSSSPDADTWRKKDLVISTQAIFKTIAPLPTKNNMTYSETLVSCFKLACELEKRVNAYVAGADIDGMKRNLADEVQAAVNEQDSHADNAEVAGPEHTNQPDDPGFDDDIPF